MAGGSTHGGWWWFLVLSSSKYNLLFPLLFFDGQAKTNYLMIEIGVIGILRSINRVHSWILNSIVALCLIRDSIANEIDVIAKDLVSRNSKAMFLSSVAHMSSGFKVLTAGAVGSGTFLAAALSSKKWPHKFSLILKICAYVSFAGWLGQVVLFIFYVMIKYSSYVTPTKKDEKK